MKIKWNNKYLIISIYTLMVICLSILFYFFILNIGNIFSAVGNVIHILNPIILGLCFAYLFNPLLNVIETFVMKNVKKIRNNSSLIRTISIAVNYIFIILLIILFLYIILPQLASTLKSILDNFPAYINTLKNNINDISNKDDIISKFSSKLLNYIEQFSDQTYAFLVDTLPEIYDIAKNITKALINIVIGMVVSVYVLANKETYFFQTKKLLTAIFSKDKTKTIIGMVKSVNVVFSGFIIGKIINSVIIGIICFIGMSIFRFPFIPLISVLVGVTNVIPYFGPFIGAIPSILLILVVDPLKGLLFAIFIFVLQQFDGNYLGPKILGETTGLTPFWVIFSIILFGGLFGVIGMFIGVPIFAIIYSLIKCFIDELIEEKNKKDKLILKNNLNVSVNERGLKKDEIEEPNFICL